MTGRKDDSGKPRYSLLPREAMRSVVEVLTLGAEKYGALNWVLVTPFHERYYDAAMRHLEAWRKNPDMLDHETHEPHLAHAICCLLFLLADKSGDREELLAQAERDGRLPCR